MPVLLFLGQEVTFQACMESPGALGAAAIDVISGFQESRFVLEGLHSQIVMQAQE